MSHKIDESLFVCFPRSLFFLVIVEQVLRGCEKRLVGVAYVRDFPKKILNVFLSGKSCEVRVRMQPNIDHVRDVGIYEPVKKMLCTGFGKTDGEDRQCLFPL